MSRDSLTAVCISFALAVTPAAFAASAASAGESRQAPAAPSDAQEKDAFDSAKALGSAEAWQAFLLHFPNGFRADLARAYLTRLGAQPAAAPAPVQTVAPAPAAPSPIAPTNIGVTRVRHSGGEFSKSSATSWTEQGQTGRALFSFEEIGHTAQSIELYDASRGVYITLDVASQVIWYRDTGSARRKLYDIIETGSSQANYAPPAYAAASPALQPARELSCREQSTIASSNSNTPAKITFINNSGMQRAVQWIDFNRRIKNYADLSAGQQITLDTFLTHPWLITDGPGNCVKIVLAEPGASVAYLDGGGRAGPAYVPRRTEPTYFSTRPKRERSTSSSSCGSGKVRVDGKCIRRTDVAGFCGPGYRRKGSKCVPGAYQAPNPKDGLPSWQKEAIKKGCPKGMAWNAAEGCHEND